MRLKLTGTIKQGNTIPFNYQRQLQAAIYGLLSKSSKEYATFLHDTGFLDGKKHLKLFTFSKLFFQQKKANKYGFIDISNFTLFFSTPVSKSFEHLVFRNIFRTGDKTSI